MPALSLHLSHLRHRVENPTHPLLVFIRDLVVKISQDDCTGLAAEMAYSLMLSIIPGLIFMFSLFGILGRQTQLVPLAMDLINRLAPPHTIDLLKETLAGVITSSSSGLTVIGLAVAFWSASNGASVLIKGLTRANRLTDRKRAFWHNPFFSMIIVASLGAMALIATTLIVLGGVITTAVLNFFPEHADDLAFLTMLRWGVIAIGITSLTAFVYALLLRPMDGRMHWKAAIPGAVTFVVLWLLLSLLFGFYVNHMGHFNPIYGVLGAVVILMTWLYLSSLMLLTGGEIAAMLALKETPNNKSTGRASPPPV